MAIGDADAWRASLLNHCLEVLHISMEASDGINHSGPSPAGHQCCWQHPVGMHCQLALCHQLYCSEQSGDVESTSLWPVTASASAKQEVSVVKSKNKQISPSRRLHIGIFLLSFIEFMLHLTLLTIVQIWFWTLVTGEFSSALGRAMDNSKPGKLRPSQFIFFWGFLEALLCK